MSLNVVMKQRTPYAVIMLQIRSDTARTSSDSLVQSHLGEHNDVQQIG